jgi:hypothetical protein
MLALILEPYFCVQRLNDHRFHKILFEVFINFWTASSAFYKLTKITKGLKAT